MFTSHIPSEGEKKISPHTLSDLLFIMTASVMSSHSTDRHRTSG